MDDDVSTTAIFHHIFSDGPSVVFCGRSGGLSEVVYLRVREVIDDLGCVALVPVGHHRPEQPDENENAW